MTAKRKKRRAAIPRTGAASFPCPACGGITRVIETRRPPVRPPAVLRARRCLRCGGLTHTRERRA